jgi:hypothetical protein
MQYNTGIFKIDYKASGVIRNSRRRTNSFHKIVVEYKLQILDTASAHARCRMICDKSHGDTYIKPRLSIVLSSIQGHLRQVALLLLQCCDGLRRGQ